MAEVMTSCKEMGTQEQEREGGGAGAGRESRAALYLLPFHLPPHTSVHTLMVRQGNSAGTIKRMQTHNE